MNTRAKSNKEKGVQSYRGNQEPIRNYVEYWKFCQESSEKCQDKYRPSSLRHDQSSHPARAVAGVFEGIFFFSGFIVGHKSAVTLVPL